MILEHSMNFSSFL